MFGLIRTLFHKSSPFFRAASLGLALTGLADTAAATPAAAGSFIVNTASATYYNARLGVTETISSNRVEARVLPVPAIAIDGFSELWLSRGARDQHHFTVRNTGNTDIGTRLILNRIGENDQIAGAKLYHDRNRNGLIDHDEAALGPDDVIALQIGDRAELIYAFDLSGGAVIGRDAVTTLRLDPVVGKRKRKAMGTIEAVGIVHVVEGGLELRKSVTRRAIAGGEELTFRLALRNTGETDIAAYDRIDGAALMIDGYQRSGVLVLDPVPLNTRFVAPREDGGLEVLYRLAGEPAHSYTTQLPEDPGTVQSIGFFWQGAYPVSQSSTLSFDVAVDARFGDVTLRNIGEVHFSTPSGTDALYSNEIVLDYVTETTPELSFVDPDTRGPVTAVQLGTDLTLTLLAGACNISPAVDITEMQIWSRMTGDIETVLARETGPNTGIFHTAPLPLAEVDAVSSDGILAALPGDGLEAMAVCGGVTLVADLPVNPGNFVFDSLTNAVIADAVVRLLDGSGAIIAETRSNNRGYFAMGSVPAGTYRIDVMPPAKYAFPSTVSTFPGFGRRVVDGAAHGEALTHSGGAFFVTDIPLDPFYGLPVTLEKAADKTHASTGEPIIFTLTAYNNMDQALLSAQILDRAPYGADIVSGSVSIDGKRAADPVRDADGDLRFSIGDLPPLGSKSITYAMRFSPLSRQGRNYNTAVLTGRQAGTGTVQTSPTVSAFVNLDDSGVFAREGTIIGSVFLDCDGDGLRDGPEEPGVPGVKIVTQEGLSVVTDIDGQYSLYGLRPVTHALALMSRTLPQGTRPMATRMMDLRRGGSRLVDLKRGELRREPFALAGCDSDALTEVEARRAIFAARDSADSNLLSDLPINAARPDSRSARNDAGIATSTHILTGATAPLPQAGAAPAPDLAEKAAAQARATATLEEIVRDLTPQAGFIGLPEDGRARRRTLSIRVKGPADLTLSLSLNGNPVAASQIGEKTTWAKGNVQAAEYVAIKLTPGTNRLVLTGRDQFGIERARQERVLTASGDPARIVIIAPEAAPASPNAAIPVVVRVVDGAGTPVEASGTVTLRANRSRWDVTDIRPDQPGQQVYIDNGEATFELIPPQSAGKDRIEVRGSFGTATTEIRYTADLNDEILVGVIEGAIQLNGRGDLIEHDRISPFEDTAEGLRGEIYLKGRIRGDALLTLRYSSDRDTEDRLFRDIRSDEYYPVYGDSSERGFDAQSSTNLFVKIEKGSSYILYGDIAIEPESEAFRLGGYSRVVTGAKAGWSNENVSVTLFAARVGQGQRVVEIPGRGISGPYDIDLSGIREGSDRIEILVRDEDTGEILETQPQRRLTDYILDYFRDTLIFNAPVRQADDDGNPISIRITYEVDTENGDRYWLYGGEVNWQVTGRTRVGLRAIHADAERMSAERERIYAAYLQTRIGALTTLEIEAAQSENGAGQIGHAGRIRLVRKGARSSLEIEAVHTGENFAPSGSSSRPGTDRLSVDYRLQLKRDNQISIEADYIADRIADTELLRARFGYEQRLSDLVRARLGVEVTHDFRADEDEATVFSFFQGATWSPEGHPDLEFSLDLKQNDFATGASEIVMAIKHRVGPNLSLSGQAELIVGKGEDRLKRFRLGFDYRINEWVTATSEISGDYDNGARSRFQQTIRAAWDVNEQLSLSFGIEHFEPLQGDEDRLTSVTFGAKWRSKDERWIGQFDLDQTFEEDGHTLYANFGLAGEVTEDLTFLARSRLAIDGRGDQDRIRHRARIGLAYRPTEDPRLAVLAWYEHRLDRGDVDSETHLWSIDATYQASEEVSINGKYAGQHQRVDLPGGQRVTTLTQLAQIGARYDFADDRAQIGVNAMRFWDDRGNTTQAIGAEIGLAVRRGSMIALGYNKSFGKRPDAEMKYQEGVYLRFRLLLDDSLWEQLRGFM